MPVALVTGAGRGIGRAVALGLSAAGYRVGLVGRSAGPVEQVRVQIAAAGGQVVGTTADVRDFAQVAVAVEQVEAVLGGVDLLVNNAGVIEPVEQPIWQADPDGWWQVVETDLRGPFHCVRAVVPGMLARGGGRVVNLNSGAGAEDREIYSAYCAAKAGLFRITGNLHLAGFGHGLRAFEISPGTVRTDMTAAMAMHADRSEWVSMDDVVGLILAAGAGHLDAWSGCFLRAGLDTPASLAAAAQVHGSGTPLRVAPPVRRLGVARWGDDDPLA